MTKFSSGNFQNLLSLSYIIKNSNSVNLDEVAHNLRCLLIQLFSTLVHKELISVFTLNVDSVLEILKKTYSIGTSKV